MISSALLALALCASAEDGSSALMSAAYNGQLSEAKAELKRGADVNAFDEHGETALMYAVSGGHEALAKLLLDKGATVDATTPHGDTALFYAALKNRAAMVPLLLAKGASTDAHNLNGATPLMVAASKGGEAAAKALLEGGAAVDGKGYDGATPLFTAILEGQAGVASLLLEKGADPNAKDSRGWTPLMAAASKNRPDCARMLVEKGADIYAADNHSQTALEYAKASGSAEIADLIQEKLDAAAAKRKAEEDAKTQARLEAEAERARQASLAAEQAAARRIPWRKIVAEGTGAAIVLLAGLSAILGRRRKARAAENEAARKGREDGVRALLSTDADAAYRAFLEYEKDYGTVTVFTGAELLKLYEVRDRNKAADPAAARRRAEAGKKTASADEIRRLIASDPQRAYESLLSFTREHGDGSVFSGGELARLCEGAGRETELTSGALKLDDAQAVDAAGYLSERGKHQAALRLIRAEPLLSATARVEDGCDKVVAIFERAGQLEAFFREVYPDKGHEFQAAYARSFFWARRAKDCLRAFGLMRVKDSDDHAVAAAATTDEGRVDEAVRALENLTKAGWSYAGWSAFLAFCLKTGRREEAGEALDHLNLLRPLRRDPKLHYALGLRAEEAGREDLAGEIFHGFVKAGLRFKDAYERAGRLPKPPEATRRPVQPERPQAAATRIAGRWDLRSELGRGRLGPVFAAHDRKLDKKAAVRKLCEEIARDPKERARFLHEARIVSRLEHPALAALREIVEEGADAYLVYEFAEGRTVAAILEERKRLPIAECKKILGDVCSALDHAHLRNVVHGALSPGGIIVSSTGGVKVLDCGLARLRPGSGKALSYLAPEQAQGADPGRAADVYALGAILRELTEGTERPPHGLAPLLASALQADPKNRMADAAEFWQELKRL